MKLNRRDVVSVIVGSGTPLNHSVIVLSPNEVNEEEGYFLGVMISDSEYFDYNNEFSFVLDDSMFTKPLKEKNSRVRLFIINFLSNKCITQQTLVTQMKVEPFKRMVKELNEKIFNVSFE